MANALLNLGNALNARGDSAAAITHWDRALEQAASTGTKHQEAKIRNNLGIAHFNLRQYTAARTCYTQSRGIFQRLGSKSDLAYTLTNLGEVMLAEGDYGGAFQSWTEAMDLYAVLGDTRGLAETSLLTEAQRLIDAEGIEPLRGVWSLWSGVVKTTQGDYAGALPLFLDAQATFESSGEARKSLQAMVRIAECTYHDGELRSAVQQLDLALARPEISEFPQVRAEALYLLGMIEQRARGATGHPPLVHFKTGLELLQREPIGEITWKLTYALAKEFFERGQRDRASQHLLETEKILRYLTANLPTENLRSLYRSADGRARVLANIERHSIVGS
jgi:tetratricopeptide (TPR) repeat protein